MKLHGILSGWNWELRHCWWRFVLLPFSWERYPPINGWSIGAFGFVFFIEP